MRGDFMAWRQKPQDEDEIDFYQTNEEYPEEEFSLYDEELVEDKKKKTTKKKAKKKKTGSVSPPTEELPSFQYQEKDYTMSEDEKETAERKRFYKKVRRISVVLLYVFFIVVGVLSTTYDTGGPQTINVNLRESRKEFLSIQDHYNKQVSVLYDLKHLDEKVDKDGAEQSFIYAVNYKDYEGIIEANVKEVQGHHYSKDYEFMRDINVVIYDNLFKYVSLMSDGLSSQNVAYIQDAQKYKKNYMTAFDKYTSNLEQFRKLVGLEEGE